MMLIQRTLQRSPLPTLLALTLAFSFAACSSGSGSSSTKDVEDFAVIDVSVPNGELNWRINRPIDIMFNQDVDFDTVSFNTIRIADQSGRPATGSFSLPEPRRVRFQPACPTLGDNSDAGLRPGGVFYTLVVQASPPGSGGGPTVQSTLGQELEESRSVTFRTPDSTDPQELFLDSVPGPPAVRLRGRSGVALDAEDATYLELGGDPDDRVYFQLDVASQVGRLPAGFFVPLNKYSVPQSRFAIVLFVDQPVQPSASNISSQRVQIEYRDPGNTPEWIPVQTEVVLTANCTETGAALRLTPVGLMPQGAAMRVNLRLGFSDLTGDQTDGDRTNFAHMTVDVANNPNTQDPSEDSDEALESFSGSDLEDRDAALAVPSARWGNGKLEAAFDFAGTGGNFDWILAPGAQVVIDTTSGSIQGGDGTIQTTQAVINGVIDVRDVILPAGSRVIFQGPNPVTILASGTVTIGGEISVRGSDSPGVGTLNTANQPEPGAKGQAGGGDGGTGSFLTSQSTPRGGNGFGAFNRPNDGGQGGETSYALANKNARRGAGGGGGQFGPAVLYPAPTVPEVLVRCQTLPGMDGEPGFAGGLEGLGAISQTVRAMGGNLGPTPFVDSSSDNDFFGSKLIDPGTPSEQLVIGELSRSWAGAGGGAGGDAVNSSSFPLVPFTVAGDEKGCGGGGGGGSLSIFAIGPIIVQEGGVVSAEGGDGGGGENTLYFDRAGGGSGGGSGGHLIFSSANSIEINGTTQLAGSFYADDPEAGIHFARPISALGGQGGAGRGDFGGAGAEGPAAWSCDAIPKDRVMFTVVDGGGMEVDITLPPADTHNCYNSTTGGLPNRDDPGAGWPVNGAGGDGSPGLIQFHVDDPAMNLRFPMQAGTYSVDLDLTPAVAPPPVGWRTPDDADFLVPLFGARSASQSRWIPLGLARKNPDPANPGDFLADEQVFLRFEGTDPTTGVVDTSGGTVDLLAPVLGPSPLGAVGVPPFIADDGEGTTIVFDASLLAPEDELYKANAELVEGFSVQLTGGATTTLFPVAAAVYDEGADQLHLTTSPVNSTTLQGYVTSAGGPVSASLLPRFFHVTTNNTSDVVPPEAAVAVFFDATLADSTGNPNPDLAFSRQLDGGEPQGFTADIDDLNVQNWDFFRFRVEFDLNTSGSGVDLDTPRPALEFLRVPFEF